MEQEQCQAVVFERTGGTHRCRRAGVVHHEGFYDCRPWVCRHHHQRLEEGWAHTFEGNAEWDKHLTGQAGQAS